MPSEPVVSLSVPGRMPTFRVLLPLSAPACTYLARLMEDDELGSYAIVRKLHPDFASDLAFMNTLRAVVPASQALQGKHVRLEEHASDSVFLFDAFKDDLPFELMRQVLWESGIPRPIAMRLVVDILDQLIDISGKLRATLDDTLALGISPDYLFIGADGAARVVGLPLALALQQFPSRARSFRESLYASPERVRGQVPGERGDVWAVGLIAWEMLTGQHAVSPDGGWETLSRMVRDGLPALHSLAPTTPAGIAGIISRACSLDASGRFPSLREFRDELVAMCELCFCLAEPASVKNFVARTAGPTFEETRSRSAEIELLIGELDSLSSWEEDDLTTNTTKVSEWLRAVQGDDKGN